MTAPPLTKEQALAEFTEYFCTNYPGPDTIISDPKWHAPKIFRAAQHSIERTGVTLTKEQAQILVTWLDVRHQLALTIEEAAGEFPEQGFIDALRSLIAIAEQ